ncbi:MAG: hypothetical protein HC794_01165 [Nitrospiraceae bacterium]|nr:hypothetical protein [Nitrospiraceae bacterium]
MTYKQSLINAAQETDIPRPLDYMDLRNRRWYAEWKLRYARHRTQQQEAAYAEVQTKEVPPLQR